MNEKEKTQVQISYQTVVPTSNSRFSPNQNWTNAEIQILKLSEFAEKLPECSFYNKSVRHPYLCGISCAIKSLWQKKEGKKRRGKENVG